MNDPMNGWLHGNRPLKSADWSLEFWSESQLSKAVNVECDRWIRLVGVRLLHRFCKTGKW